MSAPRIPDNRLVLAQEGSFVFMACKENDRATIAGIVERLIDMLDALDPDPDLEDGNGAVDRHATQAKFFRGLPLRAFWAGFGIVTSCDNSLRVQLDPQRNLLITLQRSQFGASPSFCAIRAEGAIAKFHPPFPLSREKHFKTGSASTR